MITFPVWLIHLLVLAAAVVFILLQLRRYSRGHPADWIPFFHILCGIIAFMAYCIIVLILP